MPCCGQGRPARMPVATPAFPATHPRSAAGGPAALRAPPAAPSAAPSGPLPPAASVVLRYTERSPVLVKGAATGRVYAFSQSNPTQYVDARDAAGLLRTRFFRAG